MRGPDERQENMLLGVTPDDLVPIGHPIRRIREIADAALTELSPTFTPMYAPRGRRSVPPEHLLKGTLLMALYSLRSEWQFCERLNYDLLFKWFLGLNISDPALDHTTFSKNPQRLLKHAAAEQFLAAVTQEAQRHQPISEEHFTVDGTLLQALASLKSVRPRDGAIHTHRAAGRIQTWTSAGSSARTRRTSRGPTLRPGWHAKGRPSRRACATRGTGSSSTSTSTMRPARQSVTPLL